MPVRIFIIADPPSVRATAHRVTRRAVWVAQVATMADAQAVIADHSMLCNLAYGHGISGRKMVRSLDECVALVEARARALEIELRRPHFCGEALETSIRFQLAIVIQQRID
jgi:hypothetical protein